MFYALKKYHVYLILFFDMIVSSLAILIGGELSGWYHISSFSQDDLVIASLVFCPILIFLYLFDAYKPNKVTFGLGVIARTIPALLIGSICSFVLLINFTNLSWAKALIGSAIILVFLNLASLVVRATFISFFKKLSQDISWLLISDYEYLNFILDDIHSIKDIGSIHCLCYCEQKAEFSEKIQNLDHDHLSFLDHEGDIKKYFKDDKRFYGVIVATKENLKSTDLSLLVDYRLRGGRVFDVTGFYQHFLEKIPFFYLKNEWVVFSKGFNLVKNGFGWKAKRILDVLLSVMALTLLSPLLLIVACLIKLGSPGPVLFKQNRIGLRGDPFTIYKLRTMYVRQNEGSRYTSQNDKRVTKIGRLLRQTRIDELPQLYNVIKGDMSLIGPRAEWDVLVEEYEKKIPFYYLRHIVRPGITGWAQVKYPYGASFEDAIQKLQFDLYYIKNFNFLLEFSVIFKTLKTMMFGKGL